MEFLRALSAISLFFSGVLVFSAHALQFNVGGRAGWTTSPPEKYDHWSSRNRFQVNDTLFFEYVKGRDSVLVVKREDYDACNNCHPIQKMEDGRSFFKFGNSGPFFFISGNQSRCMEGEKLMIVVLAVRHSKLPSSPPLGVSPASSPSPVPRAVPPMLSPPASQLSPTSAIGSPVPGPSQRKNGGLVQSAPEGWRTLAGLVGVMVVINSLHLQSSV